MDVPSALKLSLQLISSALQRCRLSEGLCRLSVIIDRSGDKVPPMSWILISDTGIGSCLEEFQHLKYPREHGGEETWDGVLAVRTTNYSDNEVYHFHIKLNGSISNRRLTVLPSQTKNGAKFSGTEVRFCASESTDILLAEITGVFQKILVLQIPNVTMDLVVRKGPAPDAQCQSVFVVNNDQVACLKASNVELLEFGLKEYVLKHGNHLKAICDNCFFGIDHLKAGRGKAYREENDKRTGVTMEAVIVISELLETTDLCSRSCNGKTEVLYFKDFSPSPIPPSSLNALKSIDWKSYGLMLTRVNGQDRHVLLEWENFPPYVQINIALHWYHNQWITSPARQRTLPGLNLTKKAIKHALDDLKAKHEGFLLSSHALKICSYVPDLARSIAGLIFSSDDTEFQRDCLSLLGFQSQQTERNVVEDCIKEKIVSVIGMNDRKPQRGQEAAPPSLLFDGGAEELYFQDEEPECEYHFTSMV